MEAGEPWRRLSRALLEALDGPLRRWAGLRLADAFAGLSHVYLELEGGWCGVSLVPRWLPLEPLDAVLEDATPRMLARLAARGGGLAAAFAVAAVNAATGAWIECSPEPGVAVQRTGLASLLRVERGDTVVMLGYMPGLAGELAARGARVAVAELDPSLLSEAERAGYPVLRSMEETLEALRAADIVVASGSAVLDPPRLLKELAAAGAARERVLAGPTSSFHPLVAGRLGATLVAGTYIDRSVCRELRWAVAAGAGPHSLERRRRARLVKWVARPPPPSPTRGAR
ncbi:hypothetical protein CF15_07245 [Pyrodictium occultum]|uniref:Putative heavy-metal chelation domain-containing protein n=1 Tax=Pyrodictium occultum TaxID=2309 RepID=A0A0V8RWR9_PYROC|nr:DUF364 domain-containing protein [Pyrodictium occultum]KSW12508.1 hypothetical protein CF15_07245 [Pyrodictium occultum]